MTEGSPGPDETTGAPQPIEPDDVMPGLDETFAEPEPVEPDGAAPGPEPGPEPMEPAKPKLVAAPAVNIETGTPPRRPRRRRRWPIVLAVVLALIAVLAVVGVVLAVTRYLPLLDDARALKADVEGIVKQMSTAGLELDRPTLTAIQADLATARGRLDKLDGVLKDDPLVGIARGLPPTKSMVQGADGVAAAGLALLDAADAGMRIGDQYVTIREQRVAGGASSSTLEELVALMAGSSTDANTVLADMERARTALATVPANVPSAIGGARDEIQARLDQYEPLLTTYTDIDGILPDILGWSKPVRYLVLTQDPAELKPSGGYIGSYGILAFDKGRITEKTFGDTVALDMSSKAPFIQAPAPLVAYLYGQNHPWQLAEANWSPDFPTTAHDALRLYTNETNDANIDGVLAVTTQTIDQLLAITGPVTVPGYDVTIAAGETTIKILQNTRQAQVGNRKAILSAFADQIFAKLLALPPRKWAAVVGIAETLRSQRLVQAWFASPAAQALVARSGWSGAVRDDPGDYIYPVDTNMAPPSKLNLVTTRSMDVTIALDDVGNAHTTLALSWDNQISGPEGAVLRALKVGVGSVYSLGLFERLLVPEQSRFDGVAGGSYQKLTTTMIDEIEAGRQVFGDYFRAPPGTTTVEYRWTSPYAADIVDPGNGTGATGEYRLVIQKQPGLLGGAVDLTITVPAGMRITDASAGMQVSGGVAHVAMTTFDQDIVLGIRFAQATP